MYVWTSSTCSAEFETIQIFRNKKVEKAVKPIPY